jgi:gliding motility-associated-like protein
MRKIFLILTLITALNSFGQVADFSAPLTVCVGGTVTFSNLSTNSNAWNWTFQGGTPLTPTTAQNPVVQYNSPGTYPVTLTASNSTSSNTITKNAYINVLIAPEINLLSGSTTICQNSNINLQYSILGASSVNITPALPINVTSSWVPFPSGGGGTLTITGTSSNSFSYTIETLPSLNSSCGSIQRFETITINSAPLLNLFSGPTTQTVCPGSTISTISYSLGGNATGATLTQTQGSPTSSITGFIGSNGLFNINGNISTPGSYTYNVTPFGNNNSCQVTPSSITINVPQTPSINLFAGPTTQTVCPGSQISQLSYSLGANTLSATLTPTLGAPSSISGSIVGGSFIISGSINTPGTHTYTVTPTGNNNSCQVTPSSFTIIVPQTPSINLSAGPTTQTVCPGNQISTISYIITGATGANITWLNSVPTGITTSTSSFNNNLIYSISGSSFVPGIHNYTITTTGNNCSSANVSGSISIPSNPLLVPASANPTFNQTICVGTPISEIAYFVGGSATGATLSISGLAFSSLTTSFNNPIFKINGTINSAGVFPYSVSTTGNNCSTITQTGTITVVPNPTINLIPSTSTLVNQSVCSNTPITPITFNVSTGLSNYSISNLPPGITVSQTNGGLLQISGSSSSPGIYNYSIFTTGGSTCTPDSLNGTIEIYANPSINLSTGTTTQSVCAGQQITNIVYNVSGGNSNTTLSFSPSLSGITGNFQNNLYTLSGSSNQIGTFIYTITTSNGNCLNDVETGSISISGIHTLSLNPSSQNNQNICVNNSITPIIYSLGGGATNATYSGDTHFSGSLVNGNFTITGNNNIPGTYYYSVSTNGGACSSQTLNGVINVLSSPIITPDLNSTPNQTVCINNPITTITYNLANSNGVQVYNLPNGVNYFPSQSNVLISGIPTTSGIYNYFVVATSSSCIPDTIFGQINVNALPTITPIGNTQQIVCENSNLVPINFNIGGSATGAILLGLQNTNITSSFSNNSLSLNGAINSAGYYSYTISTTGGACQPTTFSDILTIQSAPTITLNPITSNNQTVCLGSTISPINYVAGGSADSIIVTGLPNGLSTSFNINNNSLTISGTPTQAGSFSYLAITSGSSCAPDTLSGTITVDSNPTITVASGLGSLLQSICANSNLAPLNYTFGGGATGGLISGLPNSILNTTSNDTIFLSGSILTPGVYPYTITTTGGACQPQTLFDTITILSAPVITLQSPSLSDSQTVCFNSAISPIDYQYSGTATSFSVIGIPTGSGLIISSNNNNLSISGTPLSVGTINYSVIAAGGSCAPDTLSGSITVDSIPTITVASGLGSLLQSICANSNLAPLNYTFGGGATGGLISGLPNSILNSTSNDTIFLSGSILTPGVYPYTITTTGGACPAQTLFDTITILSAPIITLQSPFLSDSQTVCFNSAISPIDYQYSGTATSFSVIGIPTGSGLIISTNNNNLSISGTPLSVGTINYSVIAAGGSCAPDTLSGTITVDSIPTITVASGLGSSQQTICENSTLAPLYFTLGGGATGGILTGLPNSIITTTSNDTIFLSGSIATAGNYPYTITTTGGACPAVTFSDIFTVQTAPTIVLSSALLSDSQTICLTTSIAQIDYTFGGSATSISFTGLPNGLSTSIAGNVVTVSGTPIQAGTFHYLAITVGGSCIPDTLLGTIIVESPFVNLHSPAYTNNQLICMNTPIDTIQYLFTGTVTTLDLPLGVSTSITNGAPDTLSIFGIPTLAGSYFYSVEYNGLCGNAIAIGNITVLDTIINNQIGNDTTVCQGTLFQFTGTNYTNSGVTAYNYIWETAASASGPWTPAPGINNLSGYSNTAVLSVTEAFFRRIVTNGSCMDSSNIVQLTIDTIPTLSNNQLSYNVCSNDTVNISGLTISNATINTWTTTGNGVLQNIGSITPQYIPVLSDAGTTVLITYEVISDNSCAPQTLTGTISVNVNSLPIASAGSNSTVCANGVAINIPGTQAQNGAISWTTTGNGLLSDTTILSPIYTTNLADTGDTLLFNMVVTDTSCTLPLSDTAQFQLFVDPIGINPALNAFAGDNVTIQLGDSIQLNATGVAITSWNWTPGVELNDSTIFNPIVSPIDTTTYILTVYDINGCIDVDTLQVNVIPISDFFIPNLFSPNGDGSNDFWEIPKIPYYPNTLVTIINREGMEVYRNANYDNSWDGKFDGKELPEATYYYYIKLASNNKVYKGAVTILRNN